MPESKISVLQDRLFDQIARLSKPELKGDELADEIARTKALTALSGQAIAAGRLTLDAMETASRNNWGKKLPLGIGSGNGSRTDD